MSEIAAGSRIPRHVAAGGPKLGDGGQGTVYATALTFRGRPLVYKEYKPAQRAALDVDALERMTTAVERLGGADRDRFLDTFAWPLALVTDHTGVTGFLMPAVSDAFYSLRSRGNTEAHRLNEFQHLLNTPGFVARLGIDLSRRTQLRLLAALGEALTLLHRNGFAVGDLSPKNLLFDTDADRVYFVDCDAMTHHDRTVLPQAETPGWALPGGETSGSIDGDAYKYALVALRLLAGDQDTRDPGRLPADLDSLRPLADRAFTAPPAHRPRPGDWIPSLTVAARQAADVPLATDRRQPDTRTARAHAAPDAPGVPPRQAPPTSRPAQSRQSSWSPPPGPVPPAYAATQFASTHQGRPSGPAGTPPAPFTQWSSPTSAPAHRKSAKPLLIGSAVLILAAIVVALVVQATARSDGTGTPTEGGTAQAPADSGSSQPGTTYDSEGSPPPPSPPPVPPPAPEPTLPQRASGPPSGSTGERCGQTPFTFRPYSDYQYVTLKVTPGATTPATLCGFAMAVAQAVHESSDSTFPLTVQARSDVVNRYYTMTCAVITKAPIVLRCFDGNTAKVYFYY